eukprot:SAG11_NODE_1575_length_4659_cov_2.048904_5_plen_127_part_00
MICDDPTICAVSFVGSDTVGRLVHARATAAGKRCQANLGAKNHGALRGADSGRGYIRAVARQYRRQLCRWEHTTHNHRARTAGVVMPDASKNETLNALAGAVRSLSIVAANRSSERQKSLGRSTGS